VHQQLWRALYKLIKGVEKGRRIECRGIWSELGQMGVADMGFILGAKGSTNGEFLQY
jgi:hypothetical protein